MGKAPPSGPEEGPAEAAALVGKGLIAALALRGGAILARRLLGRKLATMDYSSSEVSEILAGKGIVKSVAHAAATRLGMRSLPRALLVGGAVLAKTLYDRKRGKRAIRKD